MAKSTSSKTRLTRSALLKAIEAPMQDLALLKSTLLANTHPKQEELQNYQRQLKKILQAH